MVRPDTPFLPLYMHRAIDLALRAEAARITPNPRVGAVLVYGDRVIGEGYHQKAGEGHAEVNCFRSIKPEDRPLIPESTLYVTLEPCAHEGRTPSCAGMLAREGVGRVVTGTLDPNPLVSGKGVAILREAGIPVTVGFMEEECRRLAKVFLTGQEKHRPFVLLKWAESLDGFIDGERPDSEPAIRLSSPFTSLLVHRLRSGYSGILVGRHTLEKDRPRLDNRLWRPSSFSPKRILLTHGDVPGGWFGLGAVSMDALRRLYEDEGITSLLVEGGRETLQSFIDRDLWDEIRVETAPFLLHYGLHAPCLPTAARLLSRTTIDSRTITRFVRVREDADASLL